MKKQCNLFLSERALQMASEIATFETLPRSAIFEEAIRRYYKLFKLRQASDRPANVDELARQEQE